MGDMADYYREAAVQIKHLVPAGHYRIHPLNLDTPKRINEFLEQDKFWVNASLEKIRIKDMDSAYLLSTMLHLLGRATQIYLVLDLAAMVSEPCPNGQWMIQQTPLFKRLRERYEKLTTGG